MAVNNDHLVVDDAGTNVGLTPAILRASRRVYQEAAPIMYGYNRFKLDTVICVDSWIKQIGSNVKDLKHIHLEYLSGSTSVSELGDLLKPAKRLKNLSWSFIPSMRPEAFSSRMFADGVQGLVEVLAERRGLEDVLRVLTCREEHHDRCELLGHGVIKGQCKVERAEAYCEGIKGVLRRRSEGRWFGVMGR